MVGPSAKSNHGSNRQNQCEQEEGGNQNFCVLSDGLCECTEDSEGAVTTCFATAEGMGACPGQRRCSGGTRSDCDAPVPGADICDGVDNNCDGLTDEAYKPSACGGEGECLGETVCEDGEETCDTKPEEPEICDGQDNDCDGEKDEPPLDTATSGCTVYFADSDADQFGLCSDNKCLCEKAAPYVLTECDPDESDCKDTVAEVNPDAYEECDGVVNDCDAQTDEPTIEAPSDLDDDGIRDECDPDDDGDTVLDVADNCPVDANQDQSDHDDDGVGDECDSDSCGLKGGKAERRALR
ncbi:MAG: hypothetical protein ACI9WU_000053 [Myxococcota bacterium]